jgi:hypothetical protein
MGDDVEDSTLMTTELLIGLVIFPVLVYLLLNIVGTVYYTKLSDKNLSPSNRRWSTASVVLGWICFPFFNLTSPILYTTN